MKLVNARVIANFVLFQVAWFACVIGAAEGDLAMPLGVTLAVLLVHFACVARDEPREWQLFAVVIVCGSALSALNVAIGSIAFPDGRFDVVGVPPWIVALWALFAMLLLHSLRWLHGRPLIAGVCGAVGSPMSYAAAERLGAVEVHPDFLRGSLVLGATWSVAVPLFVGLARRLHHSASEVTTKDGSHA